MFVNHAFRPRTSIYSRKAAVNSAFISPLYRGRVGVDYRVFYIAASCAFTAFFYYYFYLRSAYLAISVVDLHLYWWPEYICIVKLLYTASLPKLLA